MKTSSVIRNSLFFLLKRDEEIWNKFQSPRIAGISSNDKCDDCFVFILFFLLCVTAVNLSLLCFLRYFASSHHNQVGNASSKYEWKEIMNSLSSLHYFAFSLHSNYFFHFVVIFNVDFFVRFSLSNVTATADGIVDIPQSSRGKQWVLCTQSSFGLSFCWFLWCKRLRQSRQRRTMTAERSFNFNFKCIASSLQRFLEFISVNQSNARFCVSKCMRLSVALIEIISTRTRMQWLHQQHHFIVRHGEVHALLSASLTTLTQLSSTAGLFLFLSLIFTWHS